MRFAKNFREEVWTIIPMEKSFKEKHQGQQGLQDQLLDLGNPTMKILLHLALVRGMMEMHLHLLSLVLTL
jgi:hypothetical protein